MSTAVQVFKDGKVIENFEASAEQAALYEVYTGQALTDENGSFVLEFKYKGETELLNGYVRYDENSGPDNFMIDFTSWSEYNGIIRSLNTAGILNAKCNHLIRRKN